MLRLLGKIGVFVVSGAMLAMGQTPAVKSATDRQPAAAKSGAAVERPSPRPIPQMWPEQLPAQAPRVSYQNGLLTVDSQNSTLGDILVAIRRQIGVELELPPGIGSERVAAHFSGAPWDVITSLLDGSSVGFIILGSADNPSEVRKVILSVLPKDAGAAPAPSTAQAKPPAPEPPAAEDQPVTATAEPSPQQPPRVVPSPAAMVPPGQPGQPGVAMQPQPNSGTDPNAANSGALPPSGVSTQGPPSATDDSSKPKTPEQYLQELRRMRQPNQNQPQPQQNQPQP